MKHPFPKLKNEAIQLAGQCFQAKEACVILDTETTGLGNGDEVIEIAVIGLDGELLLDTLIKPKKRRSIPKEAYAVHGISMEMLKEAPSYADIQQSLADLLHQKTVLVYNSEFDERLLMQTAIKNGFDIPAANWMCIMKMYSAFRGEIVSRKGQQDFRWHKLPNAGHRAVEDCYAALEVLKIMAFSPPELVIKPWWKFWIQD